jgi:hypothetical protein
VTHTSSVTEIDVAELHGSVLGPVLLPSDNGYAAETGVAQLEQPAGARRRGRRDRREFVQAVVRFAARDHQGHCVLG